MNRFSRGALDKGRLDTLIDAVYAIALTLLVLDLKIRENLPLFEVPKHLNAMLPKIGIYAIAFSTIALLWVCHHYYDTIVVGTDFTHVMLNLAPLLFISLIPFTASVMGNYENSSWAVATFTLNATVVALLYLANWLHSIPRLVPADVDRDLVRGLTFNAWLALGMEVLATLLAFVMPGLGIILQAVIVVAGFAAIAYLEPRIMAAVKPRTT